MKNAPVLPATDYVIRSTRVGNALVSMPAADAYDAAQFFAKFRAQSLGAGWTGFAHWTSDVLGTNWECVLLRMVGHTQERRTVRVWIDDAQLATECDDAEL